MSEARLHVVFGTDQAGSALADGGGELTRLTPGRGKAGPPGEKEEES
jgi:hypothetical protein